MDYEKNEYTRKLAKRISLEKLEDCRYFPKYLTIETCNNCNAKCIMCPKGLKGVQKLELMDETLFLKISQELKKYASWIEMICLNSDGEPLLDKKLPERIKVLKDIGIKHINISTNGQLLTEELSEALINAGLDDIRISLDALKQETYEKIRVGLDFNKVISNLEKLIQIRNKKNSPMEIRVRLVELPENKDEACDWKIYWQKKVNHQDKVQIMPAHTWSGEISMEAKQKIEFYSDKPCVSVFSSMAINYDGQVQLCDSDINQKYIAGATEPYDVMTSKMSEIWQSDFFENIRRLHTSGKRNEITVCRGCDHWSRDFY